MKDFESYLPASRFVRIHKSFIVAFTKIVQVENDMIALKNQATKIPISKSYKESFFNKFKDKVIFR
jgi:DNA-binding LytR/AlgR family response regulator